MPDKAVMRVGAGAAIVGAVLALVFNILHPRQSEVDNPAEQIRLIADSDIWLFDHVMLMASLVIVLFGLWAIAHSFTGGTSSTWGRLAFYNSILGTGILVVLLGIDGPGIKELADNWAAAGGVVGSPEYLVGTGAEELAFGMFSVAIIVQFGVTPILFSLAGLSGDDYPRWLSAGALIAGLIGLAVGFAQIFNGPSEIVTLVMFPVGTVIFTLWALISGIQLWGKTGGAKAAA